MSYRWRIDCFPDVVWIARGSDAPAHAGAQRLSATEATWWLSARSADPIYGPLVLADLCDALGHTLSTGPSLDPSRLRARVQEALLDGRLVAYRVRSVSSGAPVLSPERPEASGPEPPARDEKTWVAIQLMDDGDPPQPVPFKKYRLELPGQLPREGMLDQNGQIFVEDIDPGACKISFPELHDDDWRPA
ncbi:hypothetical protein BE20_55225 [Sorangium cellulosum]|uniref:Uncharacterized protein n=1 Tax=Sorangium cellulosum TaxID=56 RepID=A0A150T756_SORCE|nr:hypothetical protein BE18_45905 [Sorangium cellulosum]KYG00545.1 hypothetical protein BE20_55225 [Sorangium cellulosum]